METRVLLADQINGTATLRRISVVRGEPPNWAVVCKAFPQALAWPGLIVTYGDAAYMPNGGPVPMPCLHAHELVHSERQGTEPGRWWEHYIEDVKFRFDEELLAHQAEWLQWQLDARHRNERRAGLKFMAERLSGPIYGSMVSFDKAKAAIQEANWSKHLWPYSPALELRQYVPGRG